MSVSARRPVVAMASSAVRASSGRLSMTRSAPPAWMTITLTWWVTTSCSSRAIRSRSSRMAFSVRSSRSRSSRLARSSSVPAYRRRIRVASPSSHATRKTSSVWTSDSRTAAMPARATKPIASAAPESPIAASDGRRSTRSPTVYTATRMPRPAVRPWPSGSSASWTIVAPVITARTAQREPSTDDQRQALEQQQRDRGGAREAEAEVATQVGEERERRKEQRDSRIDDERVGRQAGARPVEGRRRPRRTERRWSEPAAVP